MATRIRDLHVLRRKQILGGTQRGFTLVESLVALTLVLLAGSAILLSVDATVSSSENALEETIAAGMAKQLVDEVVGRRYKAASADPYQWPLGPSSWEAHGNGRERFDDADDYNGFQTSSAEDLWGQPLGSGDGLGGLRPESLRVRSGFFKHWRQRIRVYYVDPDDPSQPLSDRRTSNYRAVEAAIFRRKPDGQFRQLAIARHVMVYLPTPTAP